MLHCDGFVPVRGRSTVLVRHAAGGRPGLLLWEPTTGAVTELRPELSGPALPGWYPDGGRLLLVTRELDNELWSCATDGSGLRRLDTRPGSIGAARVRPDGW